MEDQRIVENGTVAQDATGVGSLRAGAAKSEQQNGRSE